MSLHQYGHVGNTSSGKDSGISTNLIQSILVMRQVYAYRVTYLTDFIIPSNIQINTFVRHITDVYFRLVSGTGQSRPVGIDQHIRSFLDVVVEVGG